MIISARIIYTVIYNVTTILKWACWRLGGSIRQSAAPLWRINHVVSISYFTRRRCFKEEAVFFHKTVLFPFFNWNKMLDTSVIQHFIHVIAIDFCQEGAFKSTVNKHSSIIIYQYTRIDKPAITADFIRDGILIRCNQLKWAFRTITDCHTALSIYNISKQIILAVFFYYIRSIQMTPFIGPVCIRSMVSVCPGMENITMAGPVI